MECLALVVKPALPGNDPSPLFAFGCTLVAGFVITPSKPIPPRPEAGEAITPSAANHAGTSAILAHRMRDAPDALALVPPLIDNQHPKTEPEPGSSSKHPVVHRMGERPFQSTPDTAADTRTACSSFSAVTDRSGGQSSSVFCARRWLTQRWRGPSISTWLSTRWFRWRVFTGGPVRAGLCSLDPRKYLRRAR